MNKNLFNLFSPLAILLLVLAWSPLAAAAQTKTPKIRQVDYCSLFDPGLKDFESGIIETRVLMTYSTIERVDGGDSFFYSPKCNKGDFFAVENSSNEKSPWKKLNIRFSELAKEKEYVFEVKLKGKLQTTIFPTFGHLGWSRNELEVLEVEYLKDVTSTAVKPDYEAETPLSDQGKDLKNTNLTIMGVFISGAFKSDIENLLADDFVATDSFENKYTKQNYLELVRKGLFAPSPKYDDSRKISNGYARLFQAGYKVSGFVAVAGKAVKEQKLMYENTYRYKNDSWIATEIKFSNP
jgi:hypothetical protein